MKITFYKYQGTGNDFIILDNRKKEYDSLTGEHVAFLCHRRFGIGADGLMLLNLKEGYDFEMIYYNSDGAIGSMCGNGGRCLVKFAKDCGLERGSYKFIATDGEHEASFDEAGWVQLKMKDVNEVNNYEGDRVLDTGSPHYIKLVSNVMEMDVFTEGKNIRNNNTFVEKGINVNFVEAGEKKIIVRTYERGVEDETYSCGTGVTASALVCAHNNPGFNHIDVATPGGNLAVEFDKKDSDHFENIWLCGPATFVFSGEIEVK
ncbi:MAG: diaminopimelate epimerase [Segetibacter sp.]|nr:diaminopimelate epimerase [Segetibacter sp.]